MSFTVPGSVIGVAWMLASAPPAAMRIVGVLPLRVVPELGVTQPTLSYHLKQLAEAGLLEREKQVPFVFFPLAPSALARPSRRALASCRTVSGPPVSSG